jgi:hypothetical protein
MFPGAYILVPNSLNALGPGIGQLITGPPSIVGDTGPNVTNAAVPAGNVQEVAIAPVPASMTGMQPGQPVIAWLTGAAGAAEIVPYARVSAAGVLTLCTGNLGAAPAGFGPAPVELAGFTGIIRHQLVNSGIGLFGGASAALAVPSGGAIAARQQAEIGIGALANGNTIVVANPRAALPAGFMCGYVRSAGFAVQIALANLTAAPADPGPTDWDVHTFTFDNTAGAVGSGTSPIPMGQNGPIALAIYSGLTVTFGAIPAASVVEATLTGLVDSNGEPLMNPHDGLIVCPRLAMPNASLAPSHARCAVAGQLIWGMANLDPANPVTPGAVVCDVAVLKPIGF